MQFQPVAKTLRLTRGSSAHRSGGTQPCRWAKKMKLPQSIMFFEETRREFGYLAYAGFIEHDTEETSLTAKIEFIGKHVAVSLALDRRDESIDCYITRVLDGKLARNDVSGGYWAPLHSFLIHRRNYRGSFREFEKDLDPAFWQDGVKTYARALKALAPDISSDVEGCLDTI